MTFAERVWAATARIPRGKVATYGQIAATLKTRGCRAVGLSLGKNPYAPGVPCHRVVGSDGRLTGYAGGLRKKTELLAAEGVTVVKGKVDLEQHLCPLAELMR
jgi:methylated-DNA-[protein]-cysteine S-methyltransferase